MMTFVMSFQTLKSIGGFSVARIPILVFMMMYGGYYRKLMRHKHQLPNDPFGEYFNYICLSFCAICQVISIASSLIAFAIHGVKRDESLNCLCIILFSLLCSHELTRIGSPDNQAPGEKKTIECRSRGD